MVRKRRAKSAATAESLTKQIEEPKASNEAELIGFELRPAGVRCDRRFGGLADGTR